MPILASQKEQMDDLMSFSSRFKFSFSCSPSDHYFYHALWLCVICKGQCNQCYQSSVKCLPLQNVSIATLCISVKREKAALIAYFNIVQILVFCNQIY